jgi:hypothetical protein
MWVLAHADRHDEKRRRLPVQMGRVRIPEAPAANGDAPRIEWSSESGVGLLAYGVPYRVERLNALGNAQVPSVVAYAWKTLIGRIQ